MHSWLVASPLCMASSVVCAVVCRYFCPSFWGAMMSAMGELLPMCMLFFRSVFFALAWLASCLSMRL